MNETSSKSFGSAHTKYLHSLHSWANNISISLQNIHEEKSIKEIINRTTRTGPVPRTQIIDQISPVNDTGESPSF